MPNQGDGHTIQSSISFDLPSSIQDNTNAYIDSSGERYSVFLRLKPLDVNEVDDRVNGENFSITDTSITSTFINKKNEAIQCRYDFIKVLKPTTTQNEVFDMIVRPKLNNFFSGTDALLFSYGTSCSGKSFTMQGTSTQPGIIPRVLYSIFTCLDGRLDSKCDLAPYMSCQAQSADPDSPLKEKNKIFESMDSYNSKSLDCSIGGASSEEMYSILKHMPDLDCNLNNDGIIYSVWISFYEIYNEHIFDLLAATNKLPSLPLGYDKKDDSYFPVGIKQYSANSWDEALNLYRYGKRNLHIASTKLNHKSSRSHCVFSIKLLSRPISEPNTFYSVKSFVICDLAGSERMEHTQSAGSNAVKEMQSINMSILALNKCFLTLKDSQNKVYKNIDSIIPHFRESKLTMIFKKFLTGKGKLIMIANMSQRSDLFYSTQNVLKMTSIAYSTKVQIKKNNRNKEGIKKYNRRFSTIYKEEDNNTPKVVANNKITAPRNIFLVPKYNCSLGEKELKKIGGDQSIKIDKLIRENVQLEEKNRILAEEIEILTEKLNTETNLRVSSELNMHSKLLNSDTVISQLTEHNNILEKRLQLQSNSTEELRLLTREIENKYQKRVREANENQLNWHSRLTAEQNKYINLMESLAIEFGIDSTEPVAIVKNAIRIHQTMKEAAFEELEEYRKQVQDLEENIAKHEDEIAILKGKCLDNEEQQHFHDGYIATVLNRNRNSLAENENNVSSDDETEHGHVLQETNQIHSFCKPHKSWLSDDDSYIYLPPKCKTTGKKKRIKKKENVEIPNFTLSPAVVRKARRKLLQNAPDYLGDDSAVPLEKSTEYHMSPGTIIKKTLRSGKKI